MANYNEKTGIRYGVISPNSISGFALDDIYQEGTDPHYEYGKTEMIKSLSAICEEYGFDIKDVDIDSFENAYSDHYPGNDDGQMDYSDSEYDLHVSGDNFGIFVMRSPYYTYCRNCSPCAPGAGDLDNSIIESGELADCMSLKTIFSARKTLCLGPEWFDQNGDQYSRKIPYRVFRVSDESEVFPDGE
jgi:hypothetical protein